MPYAFDDFHQLMPSTISDQDPKVRYLCALVSELAYHHVPQFEIDSNRRAKIIPCRKYIEIVKNGKSTNVLEYLRQMDFIEPFVVVTRSVVAIGIPLNGNLFVAFRGTKSQYDWRINLCASLVELNIDFQTTKLFMRRNFCWIGGRVHRGFAEEAFRIAVIIANKIQNLRNGKINQILLTGHSLGGAVAAIAEKFIPHNNKSTIIFGSPRYCDASVYFSSIGKLPIQIQRFGDLVPCVPPKQMGYSDHPYQFDTSGNQIMEPICASRWPHFIWRTALFLGKGFEPHRMELYRQELGKTANAKWWKEELAPYERLKSV